jgi:hypothetical protein
MNFEDWVRYVFDRPVTQPQWWFQDDVELVNLKPAVFIEYCTKLFRESGKRLAGYPDGQVNDGLYYIISPGASDEIFALKDASVPFEAKVEFLKVIFILYGDCFEPRCTPHLSHLDHVSKGTLVHVSPLNSICYMWWDIFVIYGERKDPSVEPLNRACLAVMEKTLTLSNIATLEGALHGLGHFGIYYKEECERIIDEFSARRKDISEELRRYALAAGSGCVL